MKPQTYFRLALLFPYILWCFCALIFFLVSSREIPEAWNVALMPISFYTFGILFWFIPYTVLAIGMWVWSRNKSIPALYKAGVLAPIFLTVLMIVEAILFSIGTGNANDMFKNALSEALTLGGFSLVFGYLCVGIALGVYKILLSRNKIKEETTINNELPLSET